MPSGLTPSERSQRARVAAFVRHSRTDGPSATEKARDAFNSRFEREVDPDGLLPADERSRRAELAKRAHFARMALRSAIARRKAAEQ
jgi:hypothetical protein